MVQYKLHYDDTKKIFFDSSFPSFIGCVDIKYIVGYATTPLEMNPSLSHWDEPELESLTLVHNQDAVT